MQKSPLTKTIVAGGAAFVASLAGGVQAQGIEDGFYAGLALNKGLSDSGGAMTFEPYTFGLGGGAFVGYNFVQGDWVFGPELSATTPLHLTEPGWEGYAASAVDLRARIGRTFGNTLVYGAVGVSRMMTNNASSNSFSGTGVNMGIGAEMPVGSNAFVGVDLTARRANSGTIVDGEYLDGDMFNTASIRAGFRF